MEKITFKGQPVHIKGNLPKTGSQAPSFELVGQDLQQNTLASFKGKIKILNIFVSLDTPVCSKSMHTFNKEVSAFPNVTVLNISMDLPFAASRFCKDENLTNVITLSAFRSTFGNDYGLKIMEGPLEGLCARAVFVVNSDDKILYSELVSEITHEPNYQAVMDCLKK